MKSEKSNAIIYEKYPLWVQLIDGRLYCYSPDFDMRICDTEHYDPKEVGQIEILLRRMWKEVIPRLIKERKYKEKDIPSPTSPAAMEKDWDKDQLTLQEAARLLRISRSTLHRMSERGDMPYKETPGGHRRFFRSDIEGYLKNDITV